MRREDSFDVACAHYRSAPELFNDEERLHLYALYKQATAGRAPGHNAAVPRMALLRSAELAAWRQLRDTPQPAARREYVEAVEAVGVGPLAAPAPLTRSGRGGGARPSATCGPWAGARTPSCCRRRRRRSPKQREDARLGRSAPLEGASREELVDLVSALRDKVTTLRVGQVMKAGELARYRETMTGGDWSFRYFEVVPGMLRCYRSKTIRDLRLEVPLTAGVAVFPEAVKLTRRSGARFVFRVRLAEPIACASRIVEVRCSAASKEELDDWIAALEASKAMGGGVDEDFEEEGPSAAAAAPAAPAPSSEPPRSRPSLLSTDSAEAQSYGGFVNLVAIVAIVSNARALLNEWRDIPLVAAASDWYRGAGGTAVSARDLTLDLLFPAEACWSLGAVVACAAALLLVERVAAQVHRYDALWHGLRAACVVATLALPLYCVSLAPVRPGTHAAILLNGCVAMMKMLSYAHTNAELRRRYAARARAASARRRPRRVGSMDALTRGASFGDLGGDVVFPETPKDPRSPPTPHGVFVSNEYPANLTAGDLARFFAFPTLVYQTEYPRTPRVRRRWLLKRFAELAVVLSAMLLLVTQFVAPTVRGTLEPFERLDVASLVERLMALAIPTLFVWILMFVALFELWLSIVAEVTRFGDRLFYRDWWNARKFDDYWRLWNLPVHNWLVRHVFFPCLNLGLNKTAATAVVFFISAALHELLVSAPCHLLRLYAFAGMMTQVPLIALTNAINERLPSSRAGNVLFWLVFCVVGQPMCLVLYFHDTVSESGAPAVAGAAAGLRGEL
ncbi:sterol O-acyltransferase [Aureococcus anophagefferens]|uniref:diacylglycerol O-acyltransferase n=2 Tax=Aureococcus anophagefferens TaxID=44056 RepID=A0ABR1FQ21_AURAN